MSSEAEAFAPLDRFAADLGILKTVRQSVVLFVNSAAMPLSMVRRLVAGPPRMRWRSRRLAQSRRGKPEI
jgi:hypothetical protein